MKVTALIGIILYNSIGNLLPGYEAGKFAIIGKRFRRFCCRLFLSQVGTDTDIGRHVRLSLRTYLGNHSSIGAGSYLQGEIHIGENVMIAPNVTIIATNHNYQNPDIPMNKQGSVDIPIYIGDDVWIAQNATILPGVRIEKGAVIGAAAVVTKNIPAYTVVAGNPAREIKKRQ